MTDQWDAVAAAMRAAVQDTIAALGPQPAPPAPPPTPAPPSVDLTRWKLTLPVVVNGKVQEIPPPALSIYSDKYWTPQPDGYLCRTWHGGGTTSGSSNPRTELRELNADGSLASWSTTKGTHTMTVVTQVNRLTKVKPHVVLAQIHDDQDDVTVWRLEGSKLYITKGDNPHAFQVRDNVALGEVLSLGFDVSAGVVRYRLGGQVLDYALTAKTSSCYFRCGLYLQSNPKTAPGESTDEYAEVVLHAATVVHS